MKKRFFAAALAFVIPVGLPALNGMLIGAALYIAMMKLTRYRVVEQGSGART